MPREHLRVDGGARAVHPYVDADWRLTEEQILANALARIDRRPLPYAEFRECTTPFGARWCACGYYELEWPEA